MRSIISWFSGLKITAILGGVIAALLAWIKIQGHQKDKLQDKVDGLEKEDQIQDDQAQADKQIEGDKDEQLKNNNGADYDKYI